MICVSLGLSVRGGVIDEMQPDWRNAPQAVRPDLELRSYGISTCAWFEYLLCCPFEFTAAIT
jgi:hypothetical protein